MARKVVLCLISKDKISSKSILILKIFTYVFLLKKQFDDKMLKIYRTRIYKLF